MATYTKMCAREFVVVYKLMNVWYIDFISQTITCTYARNTNLHNVIAISKNANKT